MGEKELRPTEALLVEGKELIEQSGIRHVFLIPDGNRRWARERDVPVIEGHKRGAENFIELLRACQDLNLEVLTVWGLSTENLERSPEEVAGLFGIYEEMLIGYKEELGREGVRFRHIGDQNLIYQYSPSLVELLIEVSRETKENLGSCLVVALAYGGRQEIIRAANKGIEAGITKFNEENFAEFLDTAGLPDPDLVIRTSGELRLSGGLAWQAAYAEIVTVGKYFPDFSLEDFIGAIREFAARKRRFGR